MAAPEGLRRPTILGAAGGVAQLAERYVRNVEAVGSNPITSTKGPVQRPKVGSPRNFIWSNVTLRDLIDEESAVRKAPMSATCL